MNPEGVQTRQGPVHRKTLNLKRSFRPDSDKIRTMVEYWTMQGR